MARDSQGQIQINWMFIHQAACKASGRAVWMGSKNVNPILWTESGDLSLNHRHSDHDT